MKLQNFIFGISIAKHVKFSFKWKRITLPISAPIYHWLWFNFYLYQKTNYTLGVQIDEKGKPTHYGCKFKWLDKVSIFYVFNEQKGITKIIKFYDELLPQYKGYLGLY